MKVALFSDVHGRLRLALHMMRCWQVSHEEFLDAALLAGDVGVFPDPGRVDRATRRWIEADPEEAGFSLFFVSPKAEIEAMFQPAADRGRHSAIRCPLLFVPGNHEDYVYLESLPRSPAAGAPANTFPVDCYSALHCIKNGAVALVRGADGAGLRVGGLWGIEKKEEGNPAKISERAANQLEGAGPGGFDLLLTHDAPAGIFPWGGSLSILRVLQACQPQVHLFGHVHPADGRHRFETPEQPTQCWIFHDVGFGKKGTGNLLGAMGILDWDGQRARVDPVEDDWLHAMRFRNWRHIWPGDRRARRCDSTF